MLQLGMSNLIPAIWRISQHLHWLGSLPVTPDWHTAVLFSDLETTSPFINEVQCFCIEWTKDLYYFKCCLISGWLLFLRLKGSVERTVEATLDFFFFGSLPPSCGERGEHEHNGVQNFVRKQYIICVRFLQDYTLCHPQARQSPRYHLLLPWWQTLELPS